jgi:hypothetical protein
VNPVLRFWHGDSALGLSRLLSCPSQDSDGEWIGGSADRGFGSRHLGGFGLHTADGAVMDEFAKLIVCLVLISSITSFTLVFFLWLILI